MVVTLPMPPSVNHYWRFGRGRFYVAEKGMEFRRVVCAKFRDTWYAPIVGNVSIEIDVYPPDNKRRDLDNILKALLDALAHAGAYTDDAQVSHIDVQRCEVVKGGKIVVRVEEA